MCFVLTAVLFNFKMIYSAIPSCLLLGKISFNSRTDLASLLSEVHQRRVTQSIYIFDKHNVFLSLRIYLLSSYNLTTF